MHLQQTCGADINVTCSCYKWSDFPLKTVPSPPEVKLASAICFNRNSSLLMILKRFILIIADSYSSFWSTATPLRPAARSNAPKRSSGFAACCRCFRQWCAAACHLKFPVRMVGGIRHVWINIRITASGVSLCNNGALFVARQTILSSSSVCLGCPPRSLFQHEYIMSRRTMIQMIKQWEYNEIIQTQQRKHKNKNYIHYCQDEYICSRAQTNRLHTKPRMIVSSVLKCVNSCNNKKKPDICCSELYFMFQL